MILGVSVDKAVTWRGVEEQFTNVWHYDAALDTTSKQVADAVVANERGLFGANVSFKRVQVWGPADGLPAQNQMLLQETLTGAGTGGSGTITAKELTAVASWDTGRKNSRGGRVYLRKYLHLGQLAEVADEAAKGNNSLSISEQGRVKTFANNMKNVVGISGASICDKKGRKLPVGTDAKVLPHLHTRQFKR
jgi:hypothetical protein